MKPIKDARQIIWTLEYFKLKRGDFYLDNVDSCPCLPLTWSGKENSVSLFVASSSTLLLVHDSVLDRCTRVGVTSLRGEERQDDTRGTHKADARCRTGEGELPMEF